MENCELLELSANNVQTETNVYCMIGTHKGKRYTNLQHASCKIYLVQEPLCKLYKRGEDRVLQGLKRRCRCKGIFNKLGSFLVTAVLREASNSILILL